MTEFIDIRVGCNRGVIAVIYVQIVCPAITVNVLLLFADYGNFSYPIKIQGGSYGKRSTLCTRILS